MLLKHNDDLWKIKRRLESTTNRRPKREFSCGDVVSFRYCGIETKGQLVSKKGETWKILILPDTFKICCFKNEKRLRYANRN